MFTLDVFSVVTTRAPSGGRRPALDGRAAWSARACFGGVSTTKTASNEEAIGLWLPREPNPSAPPRRRRSSGVDRGRRARAAHDRAGRPMTFAHGSRARLGPRSLPLFEGDSLFARVARAVCEADCLPRKELYESWEVARRTRRRFRGGRVVDLACGHGLVAHLMLVLDDSSPQALAVDARIPPSAAKVAEAMTRTWPRLAGRIELRAAAIEEVALAEGDLVVSTHACGALTDIVLRRAIDARARVVVLPCCHDATTCDTGGIEGWLDASLAIDATRASTLRAAAYRVHTQLIPEDVTPKNRLLLGSPV